VTAKPVGNNFCGVWRTAQGAALQPALSTGRSLIGTSGGKCDQLKHQYKAGDDRMEKLLLTVLEAAAVLSVSRSRVYELLYAEQLDLVKIGRSRRVARASVWRLADGPSVGVMNSRRPQGEGPDGLPRLRVDRRTTKPGHLHADAPSSRRGTAALARSIRPRSKPRPLLWTVFRQQGTTHYFGGCPRSPSPMTAKTRAAGPAVKRERSESAGHERGELPLTAERKAPTLRIGKAEPQPPTHQEGRRS
jgi:excisionase family DNA binding protein